MRYENGICTDPLSISSDLQLTGIATRTVTVRAGAMFILNGIANEDVVLEAGAAARINGTVNRDVYNRGGHLVITGVINGTVHRDGGQTIIDAKAVIRGGIVGADAPGSS